MWSVVLSSDNQADEAQTTSASCGMGDLITASPPLSCDPFQTSHLLLSPHLEGTPTSGSLGGNLPQSRTPLRATPSDALEGHHALGKAWTRQGQGQAWLMAGCWWD